MCWLRSVCLRPLVCYASSGSGSFVITCRVGIEPGLRCVFNVSWLGRSGHSKSVISHYSVTQGALRRQGKQKRSKKGILCSETSFHSRFNSIPKVQVHKTEGKYRLRQGLELHGKVLLYIQTLLCCNLLLIKFMKIVVQGKQRT